MNPPLLGRYVGLLRYKVTYLARYRFDSRYKQTNTISQQMTQQNIFITERGIDSFNINV